MEINNRLVFEGGVITTTTKLESKSFNEIHKQGCYRINFTCVGKCLQFQLRTHKQDEEATKRCHINSELVFEDRVINTTAFTRLRLLHESIAAKHVTQIRKRGST